MDYLSSFDNTIFLAQACKYKGTAMTNTLKNVPDSKKLEMIVSEDFQAGIANGFALAGQVPISIFPRFDFMIHAAPQIINMLDRFPEMMSQKTKVIIRTGVGSRIPLNPHCQHYNDHTDAFKKLLRNIEVIKLEKPEQIFPSYEYAYHRNDGKSTLLVEISDNYNK